MTIPRVLVVLALSLLLALPAAAAPAGKIVIAQGVDPTTLDMANQSETPASNVGRHIFEPLYERDVDLKVVPALAAELPKLVAPTTWEVKLRRGVKFHNGEDFNADSARFTLERLAQGQGKLRGSTFFAPIERVEVVDPHTIRVHTKKPWPTFTVVHTFVQAGMYPPKEYAGKDSAAISKNPIGTGPYKFVRWAKDEEVVLEANTGYWRGAPRIKTVIIRPIPDDAVRVAALQNGEIDLAVNIPPHLGQIIANHPKLFLSTAPSIRTIQLMFYTHQMDAQHKPTGPYNGPTADKRVREAIAYAIDADEIIKGVLDGKGVRVATMLPSMHFGYDAALKPIKQDVARAKKLLAEAGLPNGVDIVLNSPQGRYVRDKEVAEVVTGQLTKAGIRTTLKTFEFVNYLNNLVYVHKAGPIWLIGWGSPTMDAETIYAPLFKAPGIFVNWYNEDFSRMVDEATSIMDDKKRLEQYHRINRLWVEEMPAVPLYQQIDLYGVSKRVNWKARSDEVLQAYTMSLKEAK
ncbi:MAG: ABC transporter substrate-binding protein [Candidatus Rokubacteria bacterium]|nr:ABC transporter substrate-binding protein [Candidatus Rokubacteria bacterium]MBI3827042.1 ABC transporter substrate-binding protein [Candidatus Rokubacteria bacterium]